MDYEKRMDKARKTNKDRDAMDRSAGFAAPGDSSALLHLRTAMSAIEAGIKSSDWDCVAEGQAMLEVIRDRMHHEESE